MIETLLDRLDNMQKAQPSADAVQDYIKYNLIDENQQMPYLRWDTNPAAGAHQGEPSANWRSPKDHQHDPSDSQVGEGHHSPISLALQGQDGGSSGESSPISMDCRETDPRGIVESVANSVISQHLATCEADFEATDARNSAQL